MWEIIIVIITLFCDKRIWKVINNINTVAYIDDYNYKLVVSESCPLDDFILWYFYIEIILIALIKVDYRTSCALELKKEKRL